MVSVSNQKAEVIRTERGLIIAGTRITLYDVMDYMNAQYPAKFIGNMLNLSDEEVEAALSYIKANFNEVEAEYQTVLKEAEEIRQYWEERNREQLTKIKALPPKPEQEVIRARLQQWKEKLGMTE